MKSDRYTNLKETLFNNYVTKKHTNKSNLEIREKLRDAVTNKNNKDFEENTKDLIKSIDFINTNNEIEHCNNYIN